MHDSEGITGRESFIVAIPYGADKWALVTARWDFLEGTTTDLHIPGIMRPMTDELSWIEFFIASPIPGEKDMFSIKKMCVRDGRLMQIEAVVERIDGKAFLILEPPGPNHPALSSRGA